MSRIVGPAAGVVLLCWSPVAFAQVEDPPPFVLKWGTSGGGDGQFFFPIGLAPDGAGNIYVADFGNQRVQKFDSDGVFLTAWGMVDQLSQPFGVAADAVGNIYVIGRNVEKFDSNGVLLATWGTFGSGHGQFSLPQGVAADHAGDIYVVEAGNNRVQKFDNTGVFLTTWGTLGNGNGQFSFPRGVAADSAGNVYVVDTSNSRIQKFDSDGVFLAKWGTSGNGDGQFNSPTLAAVDSGGNIYIADTGNNRIQKFDSNGIFLTKWGAFGNGDGQFSSPSGVAADAAGNVYVADQSNHRIQKFRPFILVSLDVKPGSDSNPINLKSKGVIPVAILSDDDFDASSVPVATLRFGPGEAQVAHGGHIADVNQDGNLDLMLHFRTQEAGIAFGDTSASVTGETFGGRSIEGSDVVRAVGCE